MRLPKSLHCSEKDFLNLIGLIYEAAGDSSVWPHLLKRLASTFKSDFASVHVQDLDNPRGNAAFALGFDPVYQRSYEEHYGFRNIYYIRGKKLLTAGRICTSEMLCPEAEARRSEFYNEWIVPQRMSHSALNGVIFRERSLSGMLGLIRKEGAAPFGNTEISLLRKLMPHLRRSLQLHQRIVTFESETQTASDGFNAWSVGVVIIDGAGGIRIMNRCAEITFGQHDGLTIGHSGLQASTAAETTILNGLITSALQIRPDAAAPLSPSGVFLIQRPSGKRPLQVFVAPAHASQALFPISSAGAVVFISDPEAHETSRAELLASLYRLTRAETRVAVLLIEGRSLPSLAEELGVSLNTIKTHAKRIYGKTDTRGQAEFIRVALRCPASPDGSEKSKHHPIG